MEKNNISNENIDDARHVVEKAERITVLTGAGISAESGVPTFRGDQGLWNDIRPEDIATPQAFLKDPEFVWKWYDMRRQTIHNAQPNPGHYALSELEKKKSSFTLITQNIDGLHSKAGSTNIIELHGNIWQMRCTKCSYIFHDYKVPLDVIPPTCIKCNEMTRPNVVWFGEIIPMSAIDKCILAIESCEVMIIVGTSGIVEPAASMGMMANRLGKIVIEINTGVTPGTGLYDYSINGKSGEILPMFYKYTQSYN